MSKVLVVCPLCRHVHEWDHTEGPTRFAEAICDACHEEEERKKAQEQEDYREER